MLGGLLFRIVEDAWAKQPYHAAEGLKPEAARDVVKRGVAAAHRIAVRALPAALKLERGRGNEVVGYGLVVLPMPARNRPAIAGRS